MSRYLHFSVADVSCCIADLQHSLLLTTEQRVSAGSSGQTAIRRSHRAAQLCDFRKLLRTALDKLVRESFLDSWEIMKGDLVSVIRSPKSKYQPEPLLPAPDPVEA